MKQQFFKNATAFRVTPGYKIDPKLLGRRPARDCGPTEAKADGFAAPCDFSTRGVVHDVGAVRLICWETVERLLPSHVIDEHVEAKCEEFERMNAYAPGRKDRKEIKRAVVEELLPQAFLSRKRTYAVFVGDYFIIDTSSPARADSFIGAMRVALDDLPLSMIFTEERIADKMRSWLLGITPWGLTVDDATVLEGPDETKATINYQRIDLDSEEIRSRITYGFNPRKVAVTILDRVSLNIDDSFTLTRIAPAGLLQVDIDKNAADSVDTQSEFDGSVLLMAGEVERAFNYFVEACGGIKAPDDDLVTEAGGEDDKNIDGDDPLFEQAKQIVIEKRRASISLVHRHLRIGYNRAARLIEAMEKAGVVSAMDACGGRDVIV